jgi:hypothetical protein
MAFPARLTLAALSVLAVGAAACQPAEPAPEKTETTHTVVETQTPAPPVVIEREVPVPTPPVVVEREVRPADRETTTVRAGEDGIEVETTRPRP